jgi:hypothetical protein
MKTHIDPVERALQSLGGRQWPGANHNPELEQRLMQSFENHPPASLFARHKILVPALIVLFLAGASFAAAGGIDLIRSWFLTIEVNGTVVHSGEIQLDENGEATLTLPQGSLQADGNGEVTVGLEVQGDASDGAAMKTISITDGEKEVIVRVGSQPGPAEDQQPEKPQEVSEP